MKIGKNGKEYIKKEDGKEYLQLNKQSRKLYRREFSKVIKGHPTTIKNLEPVRFMLAVKKEEPYPITQKAYENIRKVMDEHKCNYMTDGILMWFTTAKGFADEAKTIFNDERYVVFLEIDRQKTQEMINDC